MDVIISSDYITFSLNITSKYHISPHQHYYKLHLETGPIIPCQSHYTKRKGAGNQGLDQMVFPHVEATIFKASTFWS